MKDTQKETADRATSGEFDSDFPLGKVEVGDEVEVHVTVEGIGKSSWQYFSALIGVVTARWMYPEGILWTTVKIVKQVDDTKRDRSSKYIGNLFLAQPCSPKDFSVFRAICAVDAETEHVLQSMQADVDDLYD